MRWAFIGFLVEGYGIGVLFGDFLLTIAGYAGAVPVVGPWIRLGVERIAALLGVGRGRGDLPV